MRNSCSFVYLNVLRIGIMLVRVQQQGESFVDMQDAHLVGLVISWGKLTRLRFPDRRLVSNHMLHENTRTHHKKALPH